MLENRTRCIKRVGGKKISEESSCKLIKWGTSKIGIQRFRCVKCGKTKQYEHIYNAYKPEISHKIITLLKEGCGLLSISRILKISPGTVQCRILEISKRIKKPDIVRYKSYELDEMCTFVGRKSNRIWVAYAIRRDTRQVVDFRVGKRTNKTLRPVVETLKLANAIKIYTDKLINYQGLIESQIHDTSKYSINRIERSNLSLRTHLKRLSRRTICYSKKLTMLKACLTIYFWM